jgi:8-oxo-dGTP pyrophosphatase MutT (NUDIX family)
MTGARFDDTTLREPLRRALGRRVSRKLTPGATTAAAVLVPLFERDGEAHVWLVRRPATLRDHAGQVAFPGGKKDPGDESMLATALREAEEELGIAPSSVDVLGVLDEIPTITGFTITPWVGWLRADTAIVPNEAEVARAFAPPLRAFFAPPSGNLPWSGWAIDGENVWGATAAILRGFVALVGEVRA